MSWSYDDRTRLQHVTSYDAASGGNVVNDIRNAYNDFNQLTIQYQQHGSAVNTSTSPKVQYSYEDATSGSNTVRATGMTYPDGSKVLNYDYGSGIDDKLSRVKKLQIGSTDIVEYEYLGLDQTVIQKYVEPAIDVTYTLATGSGANPYAGLDRFGRIIDLQWNQGSTELVRLKYGYDLAGNRTYRRDEVARSQNAWFDELYGYDGLQRLQSFDRGELNSGNTALVGSPALTQGWTLDETGNWSGFDQTVQSPLSQTRTHNTVNEITSISETIGTNWADPAHDDNGNMTSLPQPEQLDESYTTTWDAWNRLVELTDDADSDKSVAQYEYDGLNRRIIKRSYTSGTLSETRDQYYSSQWQVLEERVGTSTIPDKQFVWGQRYVDDLLLRDEGGNRLYALLDAQFNVVAITADTGSVEQRFAYQAYGQSESLNADFTAYSGTDYAWEYRYTGRELDLNTRLQLNRNRYLHLQLGRWCSRDPIGFEGSEWNLYQYCSGNTLKYLDPTGRSIAPPTPLDGCIDTCRDQADSLDGLEMLAFLIRVNTCFGIYAGCFRMNCIKADWNERNPDDPVALRDCEARLLTCLATASRILANNAANNQRWLGGCIANCRILFGP